MTPTPASAVDLLTELLYLGDEYEDVQIDNASQRGWLVESGVALLEMPDGQRFLVTVQEVTGR